MTATLTLARYGRALCFTCCERTNDLICEGCGAPLCETCWLASAYGQQYEAEAQERQEIPARPVLCPSCAA